jgi:hypothetical protein
MNALDEAEQRLPADADRRRTLHRDIVESMRKEIGPAHYEQAKQWLTKQEQAIAKTYQPFMARLLSLQTKTTVPLPANVAGWFRELSELCVTGPRQLRDALAGYDQLAPPLMPNGQLDCNLRGSLVAGIRQGLLNAEGIVNRLDMLRIYIEGSIREHGWPSVPDKAA